MLTHEYLYGDYDVPEIPAEVIVRRLEVLEWRLEEVLGVYYMDRDKKLERALIKAISFWRNINE